MAEGEGADTGPEGGPPPADDHPGTWANPVGNDRSGWAPPTGQPTRPAQWMPPSGPPLAGAPDAAWSFPTPPGRRTRIIRAAITVTVVMVAAVGGSFLTSRSSSSNSPALVAANQPGVSCSSGPVQQNAALSSAVFAAPARFSADTTSPQGVLNLDQTSSLAVSPVAGRTVLTDEDFVGADRQVFADPTDGLLIDVRVYQFSCAEAARAHQSLQSASKLNTVDPTEVDLTGVPGATGWASAGPDAYGQFRQVATATVGPYYTAIYGTTAVPANGAYVASLLRAEVEHLQNWRLDPASGTVSPPGPGAPVLLARQAGRPAKCPASPGAPALTRINALMPPTPSGFEQLPDSDAPGGPITSSQLASNAAVPSLAAAANQADGYEGGYLRAWEQTGGGAQLQVELEIFTCAAGEADFAAGYTSDLPPFAVTDVLPNATGGISSTPDAQGEYLQQITVPVGSVDLIVTYYSPTIDTSTLESLAVSTAQHLREAEGSS